MATAVGAGFDLDALNKALTKADEGIKNLVKSGQSMERSLISNFQNIAENGVGTLISRLNQIGGKRSSLNKFKEEISTTIDSANKFSQLMSKINNDEGRRYRNSAVTKINEELDEAKKRLGELRKLLNFYAKGEGKSAIGFVDTSASQKEAKALMWRIDALEREKASLQAQARLRMEVARNREKIAAEWNRMERERQERIKESAAIATASAKKESKAYEDRNKAHEAQQRFYDTLGRKMQEQSRIDLGKDYEAEEAYRKSQDKIARQEEKDRIANLRRLEEDGKKKSKIAEASAKAEHDAMQKAWEEQLKARDKAQQEYVKKEEQRYKEQEKQKLNAAVATSNNLDRINEKKHRDELNRIKEQGKANAAATKEREKEAKERARVAIQAEKQVNSEIKRERKAYLDDLSKSALEQQKHQMRMMEVQNAKDKAYLNSPKGALEYARGLDTGVKSINTMNQALQQLRNAQAKVNTNTEDGRKKYIELGNAIARIEKDLKKYSHSADEINGKHKNLINTGEQLKRALVGVFSVSAITGYVNKIVEVRGEFELQHRALSAIVRDQEASNDLWNKTVQLATKSPFRVKELVTYTKQLAAYRVETDKLYDKTKMLADISAGLGVDMNRLILAYGQVKAANYLRGTELRQFSEAGINVLQELADYYSEIEDKTISVGEVFERVSKRMVSFADVDEVLQRVTGSSGQFYKMQEQQSETVRGMLMNLRDSYDIMLNDIGKNNSGVIKSVIKLVKNLADNWELIGNIALPILTTMITRMAILKSISMANSKVFKNFGLSVKYLWTWLTEGGEAASKLGLQFQGLNTKALRTGTIATIWSAVAVAIGAVITNLAKHNAQLKEIDKRYTTLRNTISEISFDFKQSEGEEDGLEKQKEKLRELINLANKEYNLKINIEIEDLNKEQIANEFSNILNQVIGATDFANIAEKEFQKDNIFANNFNLFRFDWQTIDKDLSQFSETIAKEVSYIRNNISRINFNEDLLGTKNVEALSKAFDTLKKQFDEESETQGQYTNRVINAYSDIIDLVHEYSQERYGRDTQAAMNEENRLLRVLNIERDLTVLNSRKSEAAQELTSWYERIEHHLKGNVEEDSKWVKSIIDRIANEKEFEAGVRQFMYEIANKVLPVKIQPIIQKEDEKELADWAERYNLEFYEDIAVGILPKAEFDDDMKTFVSILEGQLKEARDKINAFNDGARVFTEEEIQETKERLKELEPAVVFFKGLAALEEKGRKSKTITDRISLIKDLRKQYLELNKTFDESTSRSNTRESYRAAFEEAGMNIDDIDFTSEQGVIAALKKLEGLAAKEGLKAKIALQKAIGDVQIGIDVKSTQEQQKDVIDNIEEMFGNYDISLELDKLNIPPDLAKKLFGVDAISLDDIRSEIEAKLTDARAVGGQEDYVKELEGKLEKVKELEDKQLKERLKTYTEYLTKEQDTRVRMKLEELRKLEEVEELYKRGKYTQEQYATITGNIRREAAAEQAKQTWEDFAKTPYIVQMFDDLDKTSNKSLTLLNDQLQTLKTSLYNAGLPASELKEILDKINQVEKELESRNPFAQIGRGLKDLFTGNIDLTAARKAYDEQIKLQKQADEEVLAARERLFVWSEQNGKDNPTYNTLSAQLEDAKKKAYELQKTTDEVTENFENAQRKVLGMAEGLSTVLGYAQGLGSAFGDMADKLGIMSEEEQAILNNAMSVVGDVANIGTAAAQIAANPANPAAWVQGISSVMSLIGNIAATGDAVREKEIRAEMKKVDRLERAYEKLEKAMEDAYTIDQMKANKASIEQNIDAQIKALESANAKEEAMKKKDQDQIDANYEKIAELEEKKAELQRETVERLGGTYDYASVAEQFLDAWLEAFKETGDGLSGLEDNFDEFFSELAKKQLIYGGITELLKPLQDAINADLGDNQQIDDWGTLMKEYGNTITNIHDFLTGAVSNLESAGLDIFRGDGGELSGLSKGIQGMSEETSNILAAYWNAVRFDVSAIRQRFEEYLATQGLAEDANPMMTVLNSQLEQLKAIRGVLDDAITGGDSTTGAFRVRVVEMN